MRVLLDEMISSKLGRELVGHEVSTVPREGWAGLPNGALLDAIDSLFDVLITMDKGLRHQQNLTGRPFGVIEVHARSSDIDDVIPLVPRILERMDAIQPGEIVSIGAGDAMSDANRRSMSPLPDGPDDDAAPNQPAR
jgi:hypothetical protein